MEKERESDTGLGGGVKWKSKIGEKGEWEQRGVVWWLDVWACFTYVGVIQQLHDPHLPEELHKTNKQATQVVASNVSSQFALLHLPFYAAATSGDISRQARSRTDVWGGCKSSLPVLRAKLLERKQTNAGCYDTVTDPWPNQFWKKQNLGIVKTC